VVERGSLENCWRRKALVGSNPTPSAVSSPRLNDGLSWRIPGHPRVFGKLRSLGNGTRERYLVGKKIFAALSTVVMTVAMLAAPFAEAAEVTRESYKEAVEPICKTNTEANEKILKGVRQKVKAGKLKQAAPQFEKAGKALHRAILQLKAVKQPTADEAKLAKWLKYVGEEEKLFLEGAKKLRANDKIGLQKVVVKLNHNAMQANNQVIPFEFKYCRFEPSKFT
jgi:hypothetical protein